jgi:hypothetical protein
MLAVVLIAGVVALAADAGSRAGTRPLSVVAGWNRERIPGGQGELTGVACNGAEGCVAVGAGFAGSRAGTATLAERWDGGGWSLERSPNAVGMVDSSLVAVSCASSRACIAVGESDNSTVDQYQPLTELWNGRDWSIASVPHHNNWYLYGVSCSTPTMCIAVGDRPGTHRTLTLAERWNGNRWAVQRTLNASGAQASWLNDVSCSSDAACTAVGFADLNGANDDVPLVERWNGHRWSIQQIRDPTGSHTAQLAAVACFSATGCTAVGSWAGRRPFSGGVLAERWSGGRWSVQRTQKLEAGSAFWGVSCPRVGACVAVGSDAKGPIDGTAVAERWNGRQWSLARTPEPANMSSVFSSVSCSSATECTAVGDSGDDPGPFAPLVDRYSRR